MDLFQTPAIRTDDMTPSEWQAQLKQMLSRAEATQQYRLGLMSPDDFADALATHGIVDPYRLADGWERGAIWPGTP
jgi:hypothetical protein